jgi:methionine-S-sulfoxide reductase
VWSRFFVSHRNAMTTRFRCRIVCSRSVTAIPQVKCLWYKPGVQLMLKLLVVGCALAAFNVGAQVQPAQIQKTNHLMETKSAPVTSGTTTNPASNPALKREVAVLAGGCFWGMEEILRKIPGVLDTKVGYTGGSVPNPSYRLVCTGITGHAEAVQITFDPSKISYEQVLGYFFRMHDPTTPNRQHNDVGTQYRSAIFYTTEEQKAVAERVKASVNKSGKFKKPVVTEITKGSEWYPAEDYHQKYLVKNPDGYNCHVLRD